MQSIEFSDQFFTRCLEFEGVCLPQIQIIDFDSFFPQCRILPHNLPHIKIRVTVVRETRTGVTVGVSLSDLDFIEGVGPQDAGACVSDRRFT